MKDELPVVSSNIIIEPQFESDTSLQRKSSISDFDTSGCSDYNKLRSWENERFKMPIPSKLKSLNQSPNGSAGFEFRKTDKYTMENIASKNGGMFQVSEDAFVAKSAPVEEKCIFSSSASVHSDQITQGSVVDV